MSIRDRASRLLWRLIRVPPRLLYALGLGPIYGRLVLLLTTTGRKSGLSRVTPLQYEEVDGTIYVASARGQRADWFRNIVANSHVEVRVKSRRFRGVAEPITDPEQIADFLELRLRRHPRMIGAMFRAAGLPAKPNRAQIEEYAGKRALVAIRPTGDEGGEMERDGQIGAGLVAMTLFRAIETSRSEGERLFDDPISRELLPLPWRVLLLPGLRHAFVAVAERLGPGALGNLFCRTRYIDDVLRAALEEGLDQVAILGAGFDTRAYRVSGIDQTHVFEVDLPGPLRLKQTSLWKAFGALPAHVTFVPIDFDRQSLDDAMDAAGFRTGARTFFIWEGVTQYITAEVVDAVLRYVARSAQAGSEIVFTYIQRGIIDGSARTEADERIVSRAREGSMPWIFGFDPAELPEYLAARGLTPIEEVGASDYRRRYLDPISRRMKIFEGEKVVLAQIAREVTT